MLVLPVFHRLVAGLLLALAVVLAVRLCGAAPGAAVDRPRPAATFARGGAHA